MEWKWHSFAVMTDTKQQGFVYLTSIMDLFSRRIIAWRLSKTLEAKWVVECIEDAKELRRITQPLVWQSDRGSQYVSVIYLEALDKIMPSYSCSGSYAYTEVSKYMSYYNERRRHGSLNYQSTRQYHQAFVSNSIRRTAIVA